MPWLHEVGGQERAGAAQAGAANDGNAFVGRECRRDGLHTRRELRLRRRRHIRDRDVDLLDAKRTEHVPPASARAG